MFRSICTCSGTRFNHIAEREPEFSVRKFRARTELGKRPCLWYMIFTMYIVLAGEPGRPELFILLVLFTLPNAEVRVLFTR